MSQFNYLSEKTIPSFLFQCYFKTYSDLSSPSTLYHCFLDNILDLTLFLQWEVLNSCSFHNHFYNHLIISKTSNILNHLFVPLPKSRAPGLTLLPVYLSGKLADYLHCNHRSSLYLCLW